MATQRPSPPRRPRAARAPRADAVPVTRGSGNVYADLGFANPEEELAKAELARLIAAAIRQRGLTQQAAAARMGIDQPRVSHILHGRLGGISTQRLLDCLTALGQDIEITVRPAPKSRKRGRVHIAAA
jgi:predicted XRE-type DNA-binding protein